MIRLLLIIVVPLILPAAAYVIWRTFVPPKFGGSEAIARDQWEPLPWPASSWLQRPDNFIHRSELSTYRVLQRHGRRSSIAILLFSLHLRLNPSAFG